MAALWTLRPLLRIRHAPMFEPGGIADFVFVDDGLEERMHRILTQLVAHRAILAKMRVGLPDFPPPESLLLAIDVARAMGGGTRVQARILHNVNQLANEAKHELNLQSRL